MAEDRRNVDYQAEWTKNLRHRPDPNRVSSLQTPTPGQFEKGLLASAGIPTDTGTLHATRTPPRQAAALQHDPQATSAEPSYYDIPMLKQPVWKWEIACYFYFGGMSAGAYLLGRAADRTGGKRHRRLVRIASYLALATLLPCPPLLIADLGDPKRFHHMLRVWKPSSPMNLGTWSIVAYSGMAAYEAIRQYLTANDENLAKAKRSKLLKLMNNGVLLALHDAGGIPFSLMVAGYTGVLLSCTSNPLWCKNPWLGALFSASALSTGAEAVSLAMDLAGSGNGDDQLSQEVLMNVDSAAHAAELFCLKGFEKFAGEKGLPARTGAMRKHHLMSMGGVLAAEAIKRIPVDDALRRPVRIVATALGLAAGFSLRWSMIFGGHGAAADPHIARLVSRPEDPAKRIGGSLTAER